MFTHCPRQRTLRPNPMCEMIRARQVVGVLVLSLATAACGGSSSQAPSAPRETPTSDQVSPAEAAREELDLAGFDELAALAPTDLDALGMKACDDLYDLAPASVEDFKLVASTMAESTGVRNVDRGVTAVFTLAVAYCPELQMSG
jgi:hypothetical protein